MTHLGRIYKKMFVQKHFLRVVRATNRVLSKTRPFARPFGRVQRRSLTSLGPLWGGVPPRPGPGPKNIGNFFKKCFFQKKNFLIQKHILWVPSAKKRVFEQKKFVGPKKIFRDSGIFLGLPDPENHFGHLGHLGRRGRRGRRGRPGRSGHLGHLGHLGHFG